MKTIKKIAILLMIFLGILAISNNVQGATLQDKILYLNDGYMISGFKIENTKSIQSMKIVYYGGNPALATGEQVDTGETVIVRNLPACGVSDGIMGKSIVFYTPDRFDAMLDTYGDAADDMYKSVRSIKNGETYTLFIDPLSIIRIWFGNK
jgi:hypothetical protein